MEASTGGIVGSLKSEIFNVINPSWPGFISSIKSFKIVLLFDPDNVINEAAVAP